MEELIRAARQAYDRAYAPYSCFSVGAAVLASDGTIYQGCNIENASYGLTMCAERTAIYSAIAAGCRQLQAIAVVADTPGPASPCGACRQVMVEFGIHRVIMANKAGSVREASLAELLPFAFSEDDMAGVKHD